MPSPEIYAARRLAQLLGPDPDNRPAAQSPFGSTGPRTEAGKNRSKMNAWRHGLTGQVAVMPWEDQAAFEKFCQEIVDSLHTAAPLERQLAQTIAEDHWRLNRSRAIETNILALGYEADGPDFDAGNPEINTALATAQVFIANQKAFNLVTLYASRINRDIRNNMAQLKQLQAERETRRTAELEEAAQLREAYKAEGLAYDDIRDRKGMEQCVGEDVSVRSDNASAYPHEGSAARNAAGQFVFSNSQIDHFIGRRRRLTLVKKAA